MPTTQDTVGLLRQRVGASFEGQGLMTAPGDRLGAEEIRPTRSAIGWALAPFELPEAVYEAWNGKAAGAEGNATKSSAAEAGFRACERAILTHGGMGYSKEFHVERYLREIMIPRIAPVSAEMILSHIAERVLGLPKSY